MSESADWVSSFKHDGFVHFPRLLDGETVSLARAKIEADLARNYDPARALEYEYKSSCPDILGSPEIKALLRHRDVQRQIATVLDVKRIGFDNGQVAIRRAGNASRSEVPHAHIDGIPTPHNGVAGQEISPFTMLVGIFLSDVTHEFAGNFTVWPGSHRSIERYFEEQGKQALRKGMPDVPLGEPQQLLCNAGDVVLCHYLLAHGAAVNTSPNDRFAVFFRLWHRDLEDKSSRQYDQRRWTNLTQMWSGWKVPADV